ncbi:hypothetical protein K1X84_06755 [bacterium]|nr:hypothetical protein [bacterium]
MSESKAFEETTVAAKLLDEFFSLSRHSVQTTATSVFFDKQYLTITEFLAPIGNDLAVAKPEMRSNGSIENFIATSLKRKKPNAFRNTLAQTLMVTNDELKPMTIKNFLDRLS